MAYENLKKVSFLIVQSAIFVVSASYYQKEISGYLFTTSSYNSSEWRNQADAQTWCNQNGSRLLAITNANIQTAVVAFISEAIQQGQLTGNDTITDGKRTAGEWKWINETSTTTLFIKGQNLLTGSGPSYAYLYRTSTDVTLWLSLPTDKNYYICEFAGRSSCINGYQHQNQCFQSFDYENVTWFEARNRCLLRGGDLATFEFIKTNDSLNTLNVSWINPETRYWIGLRREWWTWQSIDSDVTYSQWADGQPEYGYPYENFDCLCLGPNDWKWRACPSSYSAQFVCIRALSSAVNNETTRSTTYTTTPISSSQSSSTFINSSGLIVGLYIGVLAILTSQRFADPTK